MRRLLQLAAVSLLTMPVAGACGQAPWHREKPQVEDLSWMWQYTQPAPNGRESALVSDARFSLLLEQKLRAPQTFWDGGRPPLAEVAKKYFGVVFDRVVADKDRYLTIYGCVPHLCPNQGMLWVDVHGPHPLLVFAATDWTTQGRESADPNASFNLWVFSSAPIDAARIPRSLIRSIANWNTTQPQRIESAVLVDPDGTPHIVPPTSLGATPAGKTGTSPEKAHS
ncbi:MAG: hypothetical protein JST61_16250 [Acidobacteria bacterium]|nr:hypothetical protein [Acidobacteriota bacterium]